MAIIGFNFTKIFGEKRAPVHGQVSINNNVAITDVMDANISMAQSKKGVRVRFTYDSKYEPAIGSLQFEGDVVLLEDAKFADEMLDTWAKSKSVPKPIMMGLLNQVLERSNIQALIMARDLSLPAPIPLPKVNVQTAASGAEQAPEAKPAEKPKKTKK
jgi:hypothetical protein